MTNEQTAIMLQGVLEDVLAIKQAIENIPFKIHDEEIESAIVASTVVNNVCGKISSQIDKLNGETSQVYGTYQP